MFGAPSRTGIAHASLFAVTCAIMPLPASAQSMSGQSISGQALPFNVPAQPLPAALTAFARQAGIQIFFPADRIASRRSPAIRGKSSTRAALARLLAGSGLEVASDTGGTIVLRPARQGTPVATGRSDGPDDAASRAEEIVVTGSSRKGTLKRQSDTVVNAVTELEIKRLPNLGVSDVLLRLPGIRRNDTQSGENRYVSIRGLNNAAASQSIDGVLLTTYINGSRATSTEALGANFVKNVVVATTVTPDMDENANSGHVALTTISGLDGNGQHLLDARAFIGSNSRHGGDMDTRQPLRASATWRGKLDEEGRIGLAVGAGIDRLGSRQDAISVASYTSVAGQLVPNGALTRGATYTRSERVSAMSRLDFRPTDALSLFGEYFYFSHDFTTDQRTSSATVSAATATGAAPGEGQFSRAGTYCPASMAIMMPRTALNCAPRSRSRLSVPPSTARHAAS